jgi:hypothetical protein
MQKSRNDVFSGLVDGRQGMLDSFASWVTTALTAALACGSSRSRATWVLRQPGHSVEDDRLIATKDGANKQRD